MSHRLLVPVRSMGSLAVCAPGTYFGRHRIRQGLVSTLVWSGLTALAGAGVAACALMGGVSGGVLGGLASFFALRRAFGRITTLGNTNLEKAMRARIRG